MEIVPKVQEEIPRKIKSKLHVTYLKGSRPTSGVMTVSEYNQSVKDFADRLYRFALKNLNDTDLAKDFVQDAYANIVAPELFYRPDAVAVVWTGVVFQE